VSPVDLSLFAQPHAKDTNITTRILFIGSAR
jgi:hypothetical protein